MKWLYHKTLPPKIFQPNEVAEALSTGWAISPNDALKQKEPVREKPAKKSKFLSQMNVSELHDEGEKYGLIFTDETKSEMRAAISELRE